MAAFIKSPLICLLLFLLVACEDDPGKSGSTDSDTSQVSTTDSRPEVVVLKDMQIDAKTVTGGTSLLTDAQIEALSIRAIDSAFSDSGGGFKYSIIDTLYARSSIRILLISRQYVEENMAWAVSYDQYSRLLDKLQVYYDNSEGNLLVTSSITNNSILVSTENTYNEAPDAGKQKAIYAVSETYKFIRK